MAWEIDFGRDSERRMLAARNPAKASGAPSNGLHGTRTKGYSNTHEVLSMVNKHKKNKKRT